MARLLDLIQGNRETLARLFEARAKDRLASTLLFAGPSGVGKKLAALALAQSLVCERAETQARHEACGECGPCLRIEKNQSESLLLIEPDGATIKVEQGRDVLQFLNLQKIGRARVIIIDQAHLMNPQTANALLKSLEEPPSGTYFILITPLAASVLATIRSRAQLVRFSPLSNDELKKILGPKVDVWVIEAARGSLEVAGRLLESREEFGELEEAASAYFKAALERFPAVEVSKLKELTKERAAQNFAMGLVQGALTNAMKLQAGLPARRSSEIWAGIEQAASGIRAPLLGALAERSLALEQEMGRNIDRGLLLENFALELGRAMKANA